MPAQMHGQAGSLRRERRRKGWTHADVAAGLSAPLGASASVYGSIGRSLTSAAAGGASLSVTGGIAVRFSAASSLP